MPSSSAEVEGQKGVQLELPGNPLAFSVDGIAIRTAYDKARVFSMENRWMEGCDVVFDTLQAVGRDILATYASRVETKAHLLSVGFDLAFPTTETADALDVVRYYCGIRGVKRRDLPRIETGDNSVFSLLPSEWQVRHLIETTFARFQEFAPRPERSRSFGLFRYKWW